MSYQSGVPQDANQLAQNIASNIHRITQQTNDIQKIVGQLGTPQDTAEVRQILQQKQQNVSHLAKETDRWMKEFGSLPVISEQRQRKIQKDRLVNDFSHALGVFQKTQRQAAQKEREFVARVRASSRVSVGIADEHIPGESTFHSEGQSQVQAQEEAITEDDLQLIQERESTIRQLESDIIDINVIFKDLAVMVHEQGDMVDSIEANVESTEVNVHSATEQLARAANYQQKSRKKICIIIVALVVVATVVGLIIWGSVKS